MQNWKFCALSTLVRFSYSRTPLYNHLRIKTTPAVPELVSMLRLLTTKSTSQLVVLRVVLILRFNMVHTSNNFMPGLGSLSMNRLATSILCSLTCLENIYFPVHSSNWYSIGPSSPAYPILAQTPRIHLLGWGIRIKYGSYIKMIRHTGHAKLSGGKNISWPHGELFQEFVH